MQKKLKEIKPGEIFKFGGYEWIKLEQEGFCLMKGFLMKRAFDEDCNDWRKSELRKYLDKDFYKMLIANGAKEEDFLLFEIDLTADDGTKDYDKSDDYIGLLTADLYRSNRHLLKPLESWWWLATPYSCLTSNSYFVRCVYTSGTLSSNSAYYAVLGVRPLCKLSDDTLVEVPGESKTVGDTGDITELIKKWITDRDLTSGNPTAQMVKLMEKVGELANGINKDREGQIIDSIGDIYVVLVILCMQLDLDINDCIKAAYDEIKGRKGKMVNGLFVKEEDLR